MPVKVVASPYSAVVRAHHACAGVVERLQRRVPGTVAKADAFRPRAGGAQQIELLGCRILGAAIRPHAGRERKGLLAPIRPGHAQVDGRAVWLLDQQGVQPDVIGPGVGIALDRVDADGDRTNRGGDGKAGADEVG